MTPVATWFAVTLGGVLSKAHALSSSPFGRTLTAEHFGEFCYFDINHGHVTLISSLAQKLKCRKCGALSCEVSFLQLLITDA